jgi:5,10-methylenetetrahydrofolate reductase
MGNTMKSQQIPRDEWTRFFDNLSRRQEGWEVTLEVFGPDIGDQVEERHMFLAGVTAEMADGTDKIAIMMGGRPSCHVTHVIAAPTQVDLQQSDLGIDAALQIKSADGTTSLLHLS